MFNQSVKTRDLRKQGTFCGKHYIILTISTSDHFKNTFLFERINGASQCMSIDLAPFLADTTNKAILLKG